MRTTTTGEGAATSAIATTMVQAVLVVALLLLPAMSVIAKTTTTTTTTTSDTDDRSIEIVNDSSSANIQVYWIPPDSGRDDNDNKLLMSVDPVVPGANLWLNAQVGQTFEIRQVVAEETTASEEEDYYCRGGGSISPTTSNKGLCPRTLAFTTTTAASDTNPEEGGAVSPTGDDAGLCRPRAIPLLFTVSDSEEQVFRVVGSSGGEVTLSIEDDRTEARRQATDLIVARCGMSASTTIIPDAASSSSSLLSSQLIDQQERRAMDTLARCVRSSISGALEAIDEEITFYSSLRVDLAKTLANYACNNSNSNADDDVDDDDDSMHHEGTNNQVEEDRREQHCQYAARYSSIVHDGSTDRVSTSD